MINFATDLSVPWWHGLLYVFLMAFVLLIRAHACQQYFFVMNRAGVRVRTAFVAAIYRKVNKIWLVVETFEITHFFRLYE